MCLIFVELDRYTTTSSATDSGGVCWTVKTSGRHVLPVTSDLSDTRCQWALASQGLQSTRRTSSTRRAVQDAEYNVERSTTRRITMTMATGGDENASDIMSTVNDKEEDEVDEILQQEGDSEDRIFRGEQFTPGSAVG